MSVSVSGLILPKAVFDLRVSVSCLFGPKMQITCQIMYTGKF